MTVVNELARLLSRTWLIPCSVVAGERSGARTRDRADCSPASLAWSISCLDREWKVCAHSSAGGLPKGLPSVGTAGTSCGPTEPRSPGGGGRAAIATFDPAPPGCGPARPRILQPRLRLIHAAGWRRLNQRFGLYWKKLRNVYLAI